MAADLESDNPTGLQEPLLVSEPRSNVDTAGQHPDSHLCSLTAGTDATDEQSRSTKKKLILALILCFIFMIVEVTGGVIANSLAVMTDAAHLLSDVSGFAVALFANYIASQSNKDTHTFGFYRVEVLGALISILTTWLVTGILIWEAVLRVINPQPVDGKLTFILAMIGVLVNVLNYVVLGHHGHKHGGSHDQNQDHDHPSEADIEDGQPQDNHSHGNTTNNINLRGALLHVIGDLVQSIGVAVAGLVIWAKNDDPRWSLADPICTFFFAILVLFTTRLLLREVADILMERVPRGQSAEEIQSELQQIGGVHSVQDLHVWALTPGIPLLAVHISLQLGADGPSVLRQATQMCRKKGIAHSTIQLSQEEG